MAASAAASTATATHRVVHVQRVPAARPHLAVLHALLHADLQLLALLLLRRGRRGGEDEGHDGREGHDAAGGGRVHFP